MQSKPWVFVSKNDLQIEGIVRPHTLRGRYSLTHPVATPMIVSNTTCIVVCSASNVTGASTPLSADLERIVLQIAHDEWKSTTRATLIREGGGRFSTWDCSAAAIVTRYYVMSTRYVE